MVALPTWLGLFPSELSHFQKHRKLNGFFLFENSQSPFGKSRSCLDGPHWNVFQGALQSVYSIRNLSKQTEVFFDLESRVQKNWAKRPLLLSFILTILTHRQSVFGSTLTIIFSLSPWWTRKVSLPNWVSLKFKFSKKRTESVHLINSVLLFSSTTVHQAPQKPPLKPVRFARFAIESFSAKMIWADTDSFVKMKCLFIAARQSLWLFRIRSKSTIISNPSAKCSLCLLKLIVNYRRIDLFVKNFLPKTKCQLNHRAFQF